MLGPEFRKRTNEVVEAVKPFYTLLGMVGFLLTVFIGAYKIVVKPPLLSIRITKEQINYPNSINEDYGKVYDHVMKQKGNNDVQKSASAVYSYLLLTKQSWVITLRNETDHNMDRINLRVKNVSEVTSWGVSSDYLVEAEKQKILQTVKFQKSDGVIYLTDLISIPPHNAFTIYIWGKFDESFWDDNVIATYDGGEGIVEKTIQVTGFMAYVDEYIFEIVTFVLIVFLLVYLIMLGRKNPSAPSI